MPKQDEILEEVASYALKKMAHLPEDSEFRIAWLQRVTWALTYVTHKTAMLCAA